MIRYLPFAALLLATSALADPDQPDATGNIVVTATRAPDGVPEDLLGSSVTILDPQALELRQTRILSDALRDVPGIAVSRTGAPGGQTQVRLRGSEANQTLVLIDGIEVSDPYSGEFDFGTLLADEGTRVEVLRGQQSALYGSDAIGGVINTVTLSGAELPGVIVRAEGGSFGTASGAARVAGVTGGLDYALSATGLHSRGYPTAVGGARDVGDDSFGTSAKLGWAPATNVKLTGVLRYDYTDADTNDADADFSSPTYGRTVDSPGVHYRNQALFGLLRGEVDLLDGRFANVVTGQFARTHRIGYDVADADSPADGQPIIATSGDHGDRVKGSYAGTFRITDGAIRQTLTGAVDVERESERTTVSPYGAFLGWRHIGNTGAVGEYELTANDRLGLGASVRHDWNTRFADDTTWRVQASYRVGAATRFHAAGGSGVKEPSFGELFDYYAGRYVGNSDLKPERSTGWEAGVAQGFLGNRLTVDATWFDNRAKDEISTVYDADFVAHPVNLPGHTRQQGVEVEASARLASGWRLDAAYTHLHAPQDLSVTLPDETGGTFSGQAVRRAKDIASASLAWAPTRQPFSANLTVRYNGPQNDVFYGTYPPTLMRLRSFTLVNIDGAWRLTPKLELFARVENLLDRDYQEVYSFAAAGRAAYGGVRVRL